MNTHRMVIVAALLALLAGGCGRAGEEYSNGRSLAATDLAKGVLHVAYADGVQRPAWARDYDQLLETNFGISPTVFSLPSNPSAAEAWVRGYNEVAQPEIQRRFGTNVLKRTLAEAQTLYEGRKK